MVFSVNVSSEGAASVVGLVRSDITECLVPVFVGVEFWEVEGTTFAMLDSWDVIVESVFTLVYTVVVTMVSVVITMVTVVVAVVVVLVTIIVTMGML